MFYDELESSRLPSKCLPLHGLQVLMMPLVSFFPSNGVLRISRIARARIHNKQIIPKVKVKIYFKSGSLTYIT